MNSAISCTDLFAKLSGADPAARPLVIDVRRQPAFLAAPDFIAGALRRDPAGVADWSRALPAHRRVVVYCVHGHEVSQGAAQALREAGIEASFLEHGIEGWREAGGALYLKPAGRSTAWITRARPKIDRIACPWLVARFIDKDAQFLYVPAAEVMQAAAQNRAIPFDAAAVELGHQGEQCSLDAFVAAFGLHEEPMQKLAVIVRAADTGKPEAAPEAAGLLAVSQGLSLNYADDHAMLARGMEVYDALYAYCGGGQAGTV